MVQSQWVNPKPQSIPSSPTLIWSGFFSGVTTLTTHEQMKTTVTLMLLPFLKKLSTSTSDLSISPGPVPFYFL